MPTGNNFQHAKYSRSDPGERVGYREMMAGAPPDSLAWQEEMARLGVELSRQGVRGVLFAHGSLLGTDLFGVQRLDESGGLKRGYSRGIPGIDALLALMREETNGLPKLPGELKPPFRDEDQIKKCLDDRAGDAGNFTETAIERFRTAVNRHVPQPIACNRHLWSCDAHHLGRAQAAVHLLNRLIAMVADLKLGPGNRLLILAHGQAGLLLALVSNLLASGDLSGRQALFRILSSYDDQVKPAAEASESLRRLERLLQTGTALNGVLLDVVTFGTPIRYAWDPSSLGGLLHIVNHRPIRVDERRWLAKMELPQITMELPYVTGGDYVQQLAVACTDTVPQTQEAKVANKELWELLEPHDGFERWLECARKGVRCANDGLCLLVDYKDGLAAPTSNTLSHVFGHAAYTRLNTLLFLTSEIVRVLYASPPSAR